MKLNRNIIPVHLLLLFLMIPWLGEVKCQSLAELEKYSQKYPDNAVILASLRQDMVILLPDGKPKLNISKYKEYMALNDNANYFANSKETFGAIHILRDIEAYSLVPEKGGYKKIPVKSFKRTSETSNSSFYDDIFALNFTFPSVLRGTKMISKILTSSDDPSFPYKFYFGDLLPGDEYIFTVTCPGNVDIRYKVFGRDTSIINFSMSLKGGKKVYTWRASNPKSYISDPIAPAASYYIPHIIVQVSKYNYKGKTTSVNNSLDDLYKIVYKRISNINFAASGEILALTDSITGGKQSNKEKVRKIFTWVQRNIKYVAFEDGENGFVPREASLVLQRKYGDCKDKTSLLVAMMKSEGLNSSYAWIGTRDIPYKFSDFATRSNFNHMIAVWWDNNNNPVILDGTTLHNMIEDIPSSIQGKECLIEKGPDKYMVYSIPVASPEKNTVYDSLTVELKGDTLIGTGTSIIKGDMRSYVLDRIDGKELAGLPGIVNRLMPKASNKFIIESVNPVATSDSDSTIRYDYKFYMPDYLTTYHNSAYLNLNLDRYPTGTNLNDDRWIPVELSSTIKHVFVCTFKIPDGYELRDIPKNSSYEGKLFSFQHSYKLNKDELMVKTIVTLNFQVIEDNDMAQFREMLSQLNGAYIKSLPIYKTATQ